jgi:DNA-binding transcriptional ArsR family regulator
LTPLNISIIYNHMVKYESDIDDIFHALADTTRRDILRRSIIRSHTISSLAKDYEMSFTAVAKHVNVLSKSGLIIKYKIGREQTIEANIQKVEHIRTLLESYESLWRDRFERLDDLLTHL